MTAEAVYQYDVCPERHGKESFMVDNNSASYPVTLTFPAQSFRRIPNPYVKSENGDREANMYMAICDVKLLPDSIPMETNPREQNLNTNVAKK